MIVVIAIVILLEGVWIIAAIFMIIALYKVLNINEKIDNPNSNYRMRMNHQGLNYT